MSNSNDYGDLYDPDNTYSLLSVKSPRHYMQIDIEYKKIQLQRAKEEVTYLEKVIEHFEKLCTDDLIMELEKK